MKSPVEPTSQPLETLTRQRLWLQVLIAIALGISFGIFLGSANTLFSPDTVLLIGNWVSLPGKLFLLAIQFVVVPLIVASVIRGIAAEGSSRGIGPIGGLTVTFFVVTTLIAVVIGLVVAIGVRPGDYIDKLLVDVVIGQSSTETASVSPPLRATDVPDLIVSLFPRDPLSTFISGNMLQIVVVAVVIGVALTMMPTDQRKPIIDLLASIQAACMVIVGWALRLTPIAVFGLLAHISSRVGISVLIGTGMYVVTVLLGLAVLACVYLLVVRLYSGISVFRFLRAAREAILLAFSTSSSAAVMPVTLDTAESKLQIDARVSRFVIPLGTTINMAGTALYQGVATLFLAQVFGGDIGVAGLLLIVVMATGAAVGSPGTPGVGIVVLATILTSVGIPSVGIALVLGVDRLLDMSRTAVNVTGDLVACAMVNRALTKRGLPTTETHEVNDQALASQLASEDDEIDR